MLVACLALPTVLLASAGRDHQLPGIAGAASVWVLLHKPCCTVCRVGCAGRVVRARTGGQRLCLMQKTGRQQEGQRVQQCQAPLPAVPAGQGGNPPAVRPAAQLAVRSAIRSAVRSARQAGPATSTSLALSVMLLVRCCSSLGLREAGCWSAPCSIRVAQQAAARPALGGSQSMASTPSCWRLVVAVLLLWVPPLRLLLVLHRLLALLVRLLLLTGVALAVGW